MSRVFLTMAMSLDGYITGPDDGADNPAGTGGMRLMDWLSPGDSDDESGGEQWRPADAEGRQVFDEMLRTGAVITGKRTGDFAGYWGGDHHDGVPIFVPTHQPPAENPFARVHYVSDGIAECVRLAKEAAGDRDVMLHGAYTAQEALKAGVLDSIEIQLRPVLLGQGRRLFDHLPAEHIELELVRAIEAPGTLHLRYDVTYPPGEGDT
ncbi:MAG: dihydrofolate reductase family protein [Nocardioides sp.]